MPAQPTGPYYEHPKDRKLFFTLGGLKPAYRDRSYFTHYYVLGTLTVDPTIIRLFHTSLSIVPSDGVYWFVTCQLIHR